MCEDNLGQRLRHLVNRSKQSSTAGSPESSQHERHPSKCKYSRTVRCGLVVAMGNYLCFTTIHWYNGRLNEPNDETSSRLDGKVAW